MKYKILSPLIIAISFFPFMAAKAQKTNNLFVAVVSETYSFPFTRFLPIHPGLEIGTSLFHKERPKSEHYINIFLGGYYHRKVENGFYLRSEYVYRYKIKNAIGIDFPVGIGYQHAFYPGEVYEQNSETGDWERANQVGKPHALVNFGLGFTYLKPKKVQPFVRYESIIDYSLNRGFLTTRTFLKFGINIKISKNEIK